MNSKTRALLQAQFVTFLWASSFVIIKRTLVSIDPIVFAAYRYILAALLLLILSIAIPQFRKSYQFLTRSNILWLVLYGFIFIFLTQGAGYLTLSKLSPVTLSFTLNFTTVFVLMIGVLFLKEKILHSQIVLILISLGGAVLYFFPLDLQSDSSIGYLYVLVALGSNVFSTVQGRIINRSFSVNPIVITAISMLVGSILLIITAAFVEGLVWPTLTTGLAIIWLAIFNTALAFTLWNHALEKVEAVEASIILNTILPQITILSVIFLDERPSVQEWIALVIIVTSITLIQVLGQRSRAFHKSQLVIPIVEPQD